MHAPIRHRGPDGEAVLHVDGSGAWTLQDPNAPSLPEPATTRGETTAGLAFRRLKILDLTDAARQPMGTRDGSCWMVFNGEVYNFRALRDALAAEGRTFRSSGDSEVVLAAYDAWGTSCFARFEGMWALVILDFRRRVVVASRDRFGIKPLYWSVDAERLLLSSEVRQIVAARSGRPRANPALVAMHLRGVRLPAREETFFEGIHAVPPGCWFEASLDAPASGPAFRRYWDLGDHYCRPDRPPPPYETARAALGECLAAAVASHDVADVEVGALASGGLDSALLVSLLAARRAREGRPLKTYSFGFRERAPEACELPFVDALVRARGLANEETTFDAAWVAAQASTVVSTLEEPPLALAAFAQYRVFQLCADHGARVILDGQAADEVFGGYPYHQRLLLAGRLRTGRVLSFAAELRAIGRREATSPWRLVTDGLLRPLLASGPPAPAWLTPGYGAQGPTAVEAPDESRDLSLLNRRLHADVKWGNVKIILGYGDRNAMAHSVEARIPYLDRRLVEAAFALPDTYKVGAGERKRILRDCARGTGVPPAITERRDRMGFAVPEARFLKSLAPAMKEVLLDGSFATSPCFVPGGLDRLAGQLETTEAVPLAAFRLYTLALWRAAFDVSLG